MKIEIWIKVNCTNITAFKDWPRQRKIRQDDIDIRRLTLGAQLDS